jgi:hypothetical protein
MITDDWNVVLLLLSQTEDEVWEFGFVLSEAQSMWFCFFWLSKLIIVHGAEYGFRFLQNYGPCDVVLFLLALFLV